MQCIFLTVFQGGGGILSKLKNGKKLKEDFMKKKEGKRGKKKKKEKSDKTHV